MIQLFRRFFQSKIGIGVTLAFLALIGVAFAFSDVANNSFFGGVAGGDRVAVVGDRTISTSELNQNMQGALAQARGSDPTMTMEAFVAQGGLDDVVEQMLTRWSTSQFGEMMGLRASDAMVNSELRATQIFNGLNGEFDPDVFRQWLSQQNLTEARVLEDVGMGIQAQQLVLPVTYGIRVPDSITRRYAGLLNETRVGFAAGFNASDFAPEGAPTTEQLQTYYQANRAAYIRPERRVIRYATFDKSNLPDVAPVTAEQVQRRYERDAAVYAPVETRSFTQLVLPTQAAAQAVIDEVEGGMSLETSARAKGLATATLTDLTQTALAEAISEPAAEAAFSGGREGSMVRPVRGTLGWYVLRVDNITQNAGQSLAEATPAIREALVAEREQLALNELTERLEDELRGGRSLSEVAGELGLEIASTPEVTASGQAYGTQQTAQADLARLIGYAFSLRQGDPQLSELVPGEQFVIFDVASIIPSATAPLAEIREEVTAAWRREQGLAAAGAAAARVLERIEGGATFAAALAAEDGPTPRIDNLRLNRQELVEQGQLSRASILFFSMAEGTTKRVEMADAGTWFVVQLNEIQTPEIQDDDAAMATTRQQLVTAMGDEYTRQFVAAMQNSLEVETNQTAIDAVRNALLGVTN